MPKTLRVQYKDRKKALAYRNRKKNYSRGLFITEARRKYTLDENILIQEFTGTDRELARMLGRSVQGIQIKRSRLKSVKR